MKIKYILPLSLVVATAIGGINFTHAAQRINVESDVYAQGKEDPADKVMGVDSAIYLTRLSFKIPDSAQSGDFFELDMNGVAEIPKGHKFIDAQGVEMATVSEKTCVQNSRGVQFSQPISESVFNSLKVEDGPGKCKYKIIFNDNINNAKDVSFKVEYKNLGGTFALANRSYDYNAYIKVNDELKWSDTYQIRGYNKSPEIKYSMSHHETRINTDTNLGSSSFGLNTPDYLIGKKIEIGVDDNSPIIFVEDREEQAHIHNFYFGDDNKINPDGIIDNPSSRKSMVTTFDEKSGNKVVIGTKTQTSQTYATGISVKSKLNPDIISKMNLKDGDKIPVVYKVKIKDANGGVILQANLPATVTFVGSKSIAELTRVEPPKPAEEIPAQPKEQPQTPQPQPEIKTPNTGFANSGIWALIVATFGLLVLSAISIKFLKFGKIKF